MQVWVRFLSGGRRGETVPLNIPGGGAITVGRADDNHIVLPANVDVAASSHHASTPPVSAPLPSTASRRTTTPELSILAGSSRGRPGTSQAASRRAT